MQQLIKFTFMNAGMHIFASNPRSLAGLAGARVTTDRQDRMDSFVAGRKPNESLIKFAIVISGKTSAQQAAPGPR